MSKTRQNASESFDSAITLLMEKLGFKGGKWKTRFDPQEKPAQNGLETITFTVCTNPGEQLLPLDTTASGSEISRL
ncbi:MAG: hypothetical protein Q4F84_06435, partial [Fibrobacter sp.]|nr:hypothetical protein [Fibrobacter sp.]